MTTFKHEFDDTMANHRETLIKGQEIMVTALIKEIRDYGYTSIAQVNGALTSHLERLKGEQYEVDARADNFTENQFK